MQRNVKSIILLLVLLISTSRLHPQDQRGPTRNRICNQDGTLCMKPGFEQSVVQNRSILKSR